MALSDYVSTMLEHTEDLLPAMYDVIPNLAVGMVKKKIGSDTDVSTRDVRVPIEVSPAGDYSSVDTDGGARGRGSSYVTVNHTLTTFETQVALEVTEKQIQATRGKKKAIAAVLTKTLKDGMREAKNYDDIAFHSSPDGGSQGIIGYATATTTSGGNQVYTFNDNTPSANGGHGLTVRLMRRKQKVHVFSNDLLTHRTSGGAVRIVSVDKQNKTVTLTGLISGAAADDKIIFNGVTATPAWKYSLFTYLNTLTTGNLLGLSRTTYPDIVPSSVNCAGNKVTMSDIQLLRSKMLEARGGMDNDYQGLCSLAQAQVIREAQSAITHIYLDGKVKEMVDIVPKAGKQFPFGDFIWNIDLHHPQTRMDLAAPKLWGRITLFNRDIAFATDPDGKRVWTVVSTSDGSPTTAYDFYIDQSENIFSQDSGAQGFLYGAGVPSGY